MALVTSGNEIRRFGLDRINRIEILESKFKYPKDLSPQVYYTDYYGVFHDAKPLTIQLKAYKEKPNYLRSLPLHHSQCEIESNAEYTIFEYKIAPTYDFIQEILSHGNQLEVLSPDSFRQQIKVIIQEMNNFYE
jgi:predicted DNA-binding transcriptional regulator YafY